MRLVFFSNGGYSLVVIFDPQLLAYSILCEKINRKKDTYDGSIPSHGKRKLVSISVPPSVCFLGDATSMLFLRTNMCISHCCHACSHGEANERYCFLSFLSHVRIHTEKETCICTCPENSSILRISLPVYTYAMAMFLTFYRERRDLGSFLGFF